jgi:hypothetical protein
LAKRRLEEGESIYILPKRVKDDYVSAKNTGGVWSPIHLTRVMDLPHSENVDTVRLSDFIGGKDLVEMVRNPTPPAKHCFESHVSVLTLVAFQLHNIS